MIPTFTKAPISAEQAAMIASDFVAAQLGNLVGVGQPCYTVSALQAAWTVPLVLTSPGYGIVGIVGVVLVDLEFGHVVGWTPLDQMRANAEAVTSSKEAELETAFQALHLQYHQTIATA